MAGREDGSGAPDGRMPRAAEGALRDGSVRRRASMREVADLADVAISSVSRVLSGHPDVSVTMRDRVLAAVAQLEYEPDFLAQSLRRGQTLSVGFVLADISNPLMADIVLGAEAVLRGSGYSLLLMDSENRADMDIAHIRFFLSRRVDGMILSLSNDADAGVRELLAGLDVPFVLVDRTLPAEYHASAVYNDHAAGMAEATRHLVELGHRHIGLITGSLAMLPGRERVEGMHRALGASRHPVTTIEVPGSFSAEHGREATRHILEADPRPTAIIAGGNQILIGCLEAIQAAGLQVGRDISLVTCDDVPLSQLYQPPIASIGRDTVGLGRVAAELLLRRLTEDGHPETVIMPTSFTPRPSVTTPDR